MIVHECLSTLTYAFQDGWCPLIFAAWNGHIDVVDTLLYFGATVDKARDVSVVEE